MKVGTGNMYTTTPAAELGIDKAAEEVAPVFTCPECGKHFFTTSRAGSPDGGYSTVCCHPCVGGCGWSGNYHDYLVTDPEGMMPTTAPEALFAQLREMGVSCASCSYLEMRCDMHIKSLQAPEDFLCNGWEAREA